VALVVISLAIVALGVLALVTPHRFYTDVRVSRLAVRIVGAVMVLVGGVGPIALVWCVAWCRSPGRRSFYFDALLEQMMGACCSRRRRRLACTSHAIPSLDCTCLIAPHSHSHAHLLLIALARTLAHGTRSARASASLM
jgi:hypothetical protein